MKSETFVLISSNLKMLILTMPIVTCLGCLYEGPVPADLASMTIEYDFIPGFDVGSDPKAYPEINTNTLQTFSEVVTNYDPQRDDEHPLPFAQAGVPNSRFDSSDAFFLRNYAKDNSNLNLNYHYLAVNYEWLNNFTSTLQILGVAPILGNNQPLTERDERGSFIFWGDISENKLSLIPLTEDEIREYAVQVSVHELGHQRAGLTHWEEEPQYHNSSQDDCTMNGEITSISSTNRLQPFFCFDDDNDTTNSCRDRLQESNNQQLLALRGQEGGMQNE